MAPWAYMISGARADGRGPAEVPEGKHQDVDQVEGDGQQREVGQTREILQGDGKGQGRIHLDGVLDRF